MLKNNQNFQSLALVAVLIFYSNSSHYLFRCVLFRFKSRAQVVANIYQTKSNSSHFYRRWSSIMYLIIKRCVLIILLVNSNQYNSPRVGGGRQFFYCIESLFIPLVTIYTSSYHLVAVPAAIAAGRQISFLRF